MAAFLVLVASSLPAVALASPIRVQDASPDNPGQMQPGAWDLVFYALSNSVSASGGEDIVIDLKLTNNGKKEGYVDVSVEKSPAGWQTVVRPRFTTLNITSIYAEPAKLLADGKGLEPKTQEMEARIKPPKDTAAGKFEVTLKAATRDGAWTSTVDIGIQLAGSGPTREGVALSTQYPTLSGSATAKFEFKVDLANQGGQDRSFDVRARAPARWQISIRPSFEQKEVSSVSVKAGQTQGLDVTMTPPFDVQAGDYTATLQASSGNIQNTVDLKVSVVGTYNMVLTTQTGRLNTDVVAGRDRDMTIIIANQGTAPLQGITLSSSKPDGWNVVFSPDKIDSLAPGKQLEVNANIKAPDNTIPGDYAVALKATTDQTSQNTEIRVTATARSIFGYIAAGIIGLVVVGLLVIFTMMGRR
ncbi:MAG: hypothetical protein HYY29_01915 [Chloroflexi bacterium]|nr:hypothetical protein [Chloroflexota bacterium]